MPYKFKIVRISRSSKVKHLPDLITAGVAPVKLSECTPHMPWPSANKTAHSGFETQRRRHKTGYHKRKKIKTQQQQQQQKPIQSGNILTQ